MNNKTNQFNEKAPETLKPLFELVDLANDALEMDTNIFRQLDLDTIPDRLSFEISGIQDPYGITFIRDEDNLMAVISYDDFFEYWKELYGTRFILKNIVNAAKVLIADDYPILAPELVEDIFLGVTWGLMFDIADHPEFVLSEINRIYQAIMEQAKEMLP